MIDAAEVAAALSALDVRGCASHAVTSAAIPAPAANLTSVDER